MLVKRIYFVLIFIIMSHSTVEAKWFYSWATWADSVSIYNSVDQYRRSLYTHEQIGGHTLSEHLYVNFDDLRNRCRQKYGYYGSSVDRYRSKYVTAGSAYKTVKSIILDEKNEVAFADFISRAELDRSPKPKRPTLQLFGDDIKFPWYSHKRYYSNAINCNQNVLGKKYRFWWRRYPADTVRLTHAIAILRYDKTKKGNWFLLTSYPLK